MLPMLQVWSQASRFQGWSRRQGAIRSRKSIYCVKPFVSWVVSIQWGLQPHVSQQRWFPRDGFTEEPDIDHHWRWKQGGSSRSRHSACKITDRRMNQYWGDTLGPCIRTNIVTDFSTVKEWSWSYLFESELSNQKRRKVIAKVPRRDKMYVL